MYENSIILDEFDKAWQGGHPPVLTDYLARLAGARLPAENQELAWELIRQDLYWRMQKGEAGSLLERYFNLPGFELPDERQRALAALEAEWRPSVPHGSSSTVRSPSPRPAVQLAGDDLDHLPRLGEGGMGIVYGGPDPVLERDVAIKVLKAELHPRAKDRFIKEAHILARLEHPGIVPIHALGFLSDGRPYFTMKVVRGETLARLLKKRCSPTDDLPRFLDIFEQVCQTVAYAHTKDVLHRDLKPGNVMVGAFGETQVMDWGLGKLLQPDQAPSRADASTPPAPDLTAGPLGTYPYMTPEQARGQSSEIDQRTDVFGLGGILCEILTGHPPYRDPDLQHKAETADLTETLPRLEKCGAGRELIDLARRCLSPDRADRPENAGAVAAAVVGYRAQVQDRLRQAQVDRHRAEVRAVEERKRRRVAYRLGAVIVLLLLTVGASGWWLAQVRQQGLDRQLRDRQSVSFVLDQTHRALEASKADEAESLLKPLRKRVTDMNAPELLLLLAEPERDLSMMRKLEGLFEKRWQIVQEVLAERAQFGRGDNDLNDLTGPPEATRQKLRADYANAFAAHGLNVKGVRVADFLTRVRESRIRRTLLDGLDQWFLLEPDSDVLLAVLNSLDESRSP